MADDVALKGGDASGVPVPLPEGAEFVSHARRPASSTTASSLGVILILGDLFALASAWLVMDVALHRWWGQTWSMAFGDSMALVAGGMAMLRFLGLHRARTCVMRSVEVAKVGRVALCSGLGAYALGLVPRNHVRVAVAGGALVFVMLVVERGIYRAWVRGIRRKGKGLRRVLVLASTADAEAIESEISNYPEHGYEVGGVMTLPAPTNDPPPLTGVGLAGRVLDEARALDVSGLVVATGAVPATGMAQLVRCALTMGLHVQVWGGLPGIDQRRLQPLPFGHQPGFYLAPSAVSDWQRVAKRVVDLIIAPLVLILASPVIALVMLLIKLEDGGPVLFRQRRVGKDGREFTLHKFRSMVVDAEVRLADLAGQNERHGPLFKLDVDPRTTKIGRLLRATSLDELPQLFNVIKGEMTLVGPRPALADEVAQFDEELLRRLRVSPGVTGLWQVEARDNPSFDVYRSLDLFYVDNWSIGTDLAILASTAGAVLGRSFRALRVPAVHRTRQAKKIAGGGIGGVRIDWIEIDEAISRITEGAKARFCGQVSTVNLDFLATARRDPEARTILTESWLSLPDGAPVVWLGRLKGVRTSGRVSGSDLVPRLAAKAAAERIPLFLLGGENGAARTAADRLVARHPDLRVSVYEPPRAALEDMDDEEIFRRLAEKQPALLLVAFGHPKQEKWIHRNRHRLPMVAMGVGCCFDLIAGHQRRAPSWMQRAGLEWAYRLAREPGRLARRYVIDGKWLMLHFFPAALYHRLVKDSDPRPVLEPLIGMNAGLRAGEEMEPPGLVSLLAGGDPPPGTALIDLGVGAESVVDEFGQMTA